MARAMVASPSASPNGKDPLLLVEAGGCRFALFLRQVQEIFAPRAMSRLFRAPAAVRGLTSLRGDILPVVDLRVLLELPPPGRHPPDPRIVVLRADGELRQRVGLWVEAVGEVVSLPEVLDRPPATIAEGILPFIEGVVPGPPLAAVLSTARVLAAPALATLAERPRRPG